MRYLIFWLLITLNASAALVLNNASIGQYQNGPTPVAPDTIGGLGISNWWISADLAANAAVSDWMDRKSFFHWTQATGGNQPTNSSSGVCFVSPRFLNGTNVFYNPGLVTFVVFQAIRNGSDVDNGSLFASTTISAQTALYLSTFGGGVPTWKYDWVAGNFDFGAVANNVAQDLIIGGDSASWYTNGVAAPAISGVSYGWGWSEASFIGKDKSTRYFDGYLAELVVFTNTTITSVQVSNLHYYRTNFYGGSP